VHRDVVITETDENKGLSVMDMRYVFDNPKFNHHVVLDFDYNDFINDFIQTMVSKDGNMYK
jgi:purine nucleosidase